jgi:hypothetical protein
VELSFLGVNDLLNHNIDNKVILLLFF